MVKDLAFTTGVETLVMKDRQEKNPTSSKPVISIMKINLLPEKMATLRINMHTKKGKWYSMEYWFYSCSLKFRDP